MEVHHKSFQFIKIYWFCINMLLKCLLLLVILDTVWSTKQNVEDFICVNGNKIDIKNICNGIPDCEDESDETNELCYHTICPKGMFRCLYGACVEEKAKCDGKVDCIDKSDESQCGRKKGSCEINEFLCKSEECISIEKLCNGEDDCEDGSDETKSSCDELPCPEESFKCTHGGCIHLDGRCDGKRDCIDGSDESDTLCENLKCSGDQCSKIRNKVHCPQMDISRVNAKCQSTYGTVPCDNPIPVGTKIKYECKPFFVPFNHKHIHNTHAECQLDGTWNKQLLKCKPDCGLLDSGPITLVWNGWDTHKTVYPWHAAMFVKEDGKLNMWCGGTLITETTVLTAGHCVWNVEASNIQLAFGKYYSDFAKDEPITQKRNVKKIVTQPLYQDRSGNYGSDLAILVLDQPVKLSSAIHPACVDWDLQDIKHNLKENTTGLVVGMGVTETEEFSAVLKGVYIPVVSNEKCIKDQVEDFRKFITYNVICAGWKNGTGVCNGDSGGGLLFQKVNDKSRWVIQGLVSISPRKRGTSFCDPAYYTVFTKVAIYINWLKDILSELNQSVV